ncbi:hypothetical protein EDD15DRAFT_2168055, partial [Pisolithus albus]
ARHLYRWLVDLTSSSSTEYSLRFTRAHVPVMSTDTYANNVADRLACKAQSFPRPLPAPVPTFMFDPFFLYTTHTGFIESTSSPVIQQLYTRLICSSSRFTPTTTLLPSLYDPHPPPAYRYTKASSAFSAVVQLYARSCQLDTAATRFSRHDGSTPHCHFGCASLETAHHIFVSCHRFQRLRQEYSRHVLQQTDKFLSEAETTCPFQEDCLHSAQSSWPTEPTCFVGDTKHHILHAAASLFVDDPSVWPQSLSHYYLGTMPAIPGSLCARCFPLLLRNIVGLWHEQCILLAGRIWGEYKRARSYRPPQSSVTSFELPHHLRYFLSS